MLDKLKSSKARRQFYAWCAVAFLFAVGMLIGVNHILKPWCETQPAAQTGSAPSASAQNQPASPQCNAFNQLALDILPALSIQIISTSLTAALFLFFLTLVKDNEEALKDVEVLPQPEQKYRHRDALKKTAFWYHDGHSASYVTGTVLPEFQRRSQKERCPCKIKVAIMDPTDDKVCRTYLAHLNGLSENERRFPDLNSIKARLCASIYLLVAGHQTHNLTVEIYLKKRIDLIRTDITESRAFWTTVGEDAPAISLNNRSGYKSFHYNLVKNNFKANFRGDKDHRVEIDQAHTAYENVHNQRQSDRIKDVLQFIFPNDPSLYSDDNIKRITKHLPKG
ncbi:MAG: hypothetical protein QOD28_507 [Acidobacteriota bacterium]|nr:hypothetical protein [Acidobacteriota bacterium]